MEAIFCCIFIIFALVVVIFLSVKRSISDSKYKKELQDEINETGYSKTKSVGSLYVDEVHKKWWIFVKGSFPVFHDYSDILDFELVVDGEKYKNKGGVTRAIAGGLLFGGVGALVGASTAKTQKTIKTMYITVFLKGGNVEKIHFIDSETKVDSFFYKLGKENAEEATALLTNMIYEAQNNNLSNDINSEAKNKIEGEIYTKLVGVTQNNDEGVSIQSVLPQINEGALLELKREPDNPFDENAIKVLWNNNRIGYISKDIAANLAPVMDRGSKALGRVEGITGGDENTYGCNISISVID